MSRARKFKSIYEIVREASLIHSWKYTYENFTELKMMVKSRITCPVHGEFQQTMNKHLNGQGCPRCAGKVKKTTEEFIAEAMAVHGDRYDYSQTVYTSNKTGLTIICRDHGKFCQSPVGHVLQSQGCPHCAGKLRRTTEEFICAAKEIHGNRYDYSKVNYVNNKTKVLIGCRIHGNFETLPIAHIHKKTGCRICNVTGGYSHYWFRKNPADRSIPAILYVVQFVNGEDTFYKIGITKKDVKNRFKVVERLGIEVREIATFNSELYSAFIAEQELLGRIKLRFPTPTDIFIGGGESECFIATEAELADFISDVGERFRSSPLR